MAAGIRDRDAGPSPAGTDGSRRLAAVAWVVIAFAAVPSIAWQEVAGQPARGLKLAVVAGLAALAAVASRWSPWLPLRGFLLALVAVAAGDVAADVVAGSAAWKDWVREAPYPLAKLAAVCLPALGLLLAGCTLLGAGLRRRDLFLGTGDTAAPVRGQPKVPGFSEGEPWRRALLGRRGFLPVFVAILVLVEVVQVGTGGTDIARLLVWMPGILAAAAVNALREELLFRSILLSRLVPAVGATNAVWLTAALFGLGHYFGSPHGVPGVVLAGFLGLVFGKCVLETRGLLLVLFAHFVGDVILYVFEGATFT